MGKRLFLVILAVLFLAMPAYADIFGPTSKDLIDIGGTKTFKERVNQAQKPKLDIDSSTVSTYILSVINALGLREGFGYDWKGKDVVNVSGATLYTKYNICLNLHAYNTEGGGGGIAYNLGAIMSDDWTIKKYVSYLYAGASVGERHYDNKWNFAVLAPVVEFKATW